MDWIQDARKGCWELRMGRGGPTQKQLEYLLVFDITFSLNIEQLLFEQG